MRLRFCIKDTRQRLLIYENTNLEIIKTLHSGFNEQKKQPLANAAAAGTLPWTHMLISVKATAVMAIRGHLL